jgi:Cytotoxic
MPYVPAPEGLPGFPDARRVEPKNQRRRWSDRRGRIFEWDYQHGTVEVYDRRGRHLGEFDPGTGARRKGPDRARRIEP